MSIVQARVGRIAITDAHTSVQLASFDYSFQRGMSRAIEAAVYEDVLSFVWGSIPAFMLDATIFGIQIEEALHADDEFIPLYSREPMSSMQLIQCVLKLRAKMARAGAQDVVTTLPAGVERVLQDLFKTPWRAVA